VGRWRHLLDRLAEAAFCARRGRPDARPAAGQGARHLGPGPGSYGRNDAGDAGIDASRIDIDTNESDPADSLAGQLMGLPQKSLQGFGVPAESDGFANKRLAWETPMVRSQSAGWRPASPCPAPG
jgi:hypothetical protein